MRAPSAIAANFSQAMLGSPSLKCTSGGETAVSHRDDTLAADDLGEALDALGDQLRVLHQVGGVADDTVVSAPGAASV